MVKNNMDLETEDYDGLFQSFWQIAAFVVCIIALLLICYLVIRACWIKHKQRNSRRDASESFSNNMEQKIVLNPGISTS